MLDLIVHASGACVPYLYRAYRTCTTRTRRVYRVFTACCFRHIVVIVCVCE